MPRRTEILILVPIAAIMATAGIAYHVIAQREAREAAQERLDTTSQVASELLVRKIDSLDSILRGALAQQSLANYLMFRDAELLDEAEHNRHEVERSLQDIAGQDRSIITLSLFDEDDHRFVGIVEGQRTLAPYVAVDRNTYHEAGKRGVQFSSDGTIRIRRTMQSNHFPHVAASGEIEYDLNKLAGDVARLCERQLQHCEFRLIDSNGIVRYREGAVAPANPAIISRAKLNVPDGVVEIVHDESAALAAFHQSESMLFVALAVVTVLLVTMTAVGTRYVTRELRRANRLLEANEHRLRETTRQAETANQAKTDFLANMSHEIRTPMTAILGFSELLKSEELSVLEQRDCLETVIRNGKHLLTLINQILDLTKIEAGKLEIEISDCCPSTLLRDIDQLFRSQAEAKGIVFDVQSDADLPAVIKTDPTRLKQALVNLVGNAIKFTNQGQVVVSQRVDRQRQLLEFRISDTGIGMTREQADRIFQPFLQADNSTTRKYGGTGLGLSITKQIASLLGGNIIVESTIGEGSTFRLTVATGPLDSRAESRSEGAPQSEHDESNPELSIRGRVLVVDDGLDNQRLLVHILKRANFIVESANDGREGVEQAIYAWREDSPFHVILMDLQMPRVDGYQATEELRAEGYPGQIVALTAHAMKTDMSRCLENGFDGYITKPVGRERLVEEVFRRVRLSEAIYADAEAKTVLA